jgi:hypothetical protein
MYSRLIYTLASVLLLCACSTHNKSITFETVTATKTVALSNDQVPPSCTVNIRLAQATAESGRAGEIINATVASQLLKHTDNGLQQAAEAFADDYTSNYLKTLLPLYNQDRRDPRKHAWYHYHYIINSHAQAGAKGTVNYIAETNYREGGNHVVSYQTVMNFEAATGRQLTTKDVFVDGFETGLKPILLKALCEKTGLGTVRDLHDKGYLRGMNIYVPENFILGSDAITFIYNPDEIAPYSLGSIELTIAYTAIEKILASTFEH